MLLCIALRVPNVYSHGILPHVQLLYSYLRQIYHRRAPWGGTTVALPPAGVVYTIILRAPFLLD